MSYKFKKDDPNYRPHQPRRRGIAGNQFTGTEKKEVNEISNNEDGVSIFQDRKL